MLSWTDTGTRCYPIFRCQTEFILFLQSKDIKDMNRKWFTATKTFMACNALPITRSRELFITNVRKRKPTEEKKQLATNRNKKAVCEIAHSHRLMHIWHDFTVISRVSLYLHPSTPQLNPSPGVPLVIVANTASPNPLFSEHWAPSLFKQI